jgi:hypothetical protein
VPSPLERLCLLLDKSMPLVESSYPSTRRKVCALALLALLTPPPAFIGPGGKYAFLGCAIDLLWHMAMQARFSSFVSDGGFEPILARLATAVEVCISVTRVVEEERSELDDGTVDDVETLCVHLRGGDDTVRFLFKVTTVCPDMRIWLASHNASKRYSSVIRCTPRISGKPHHAHRWTAVRGAPQ